MRTFDELVQRFRQLDDLLRGQGIPASVDGRLRTRLFSIDTPHGRRRAFVAWALVGCVMTCCAAIAVAVVWRLPPRLQDFSAARACPGLRQEADGSVTTQGSRCDLEMPGDAVALQLENGARVRREGTGLRVKSGRVMFKVTHRNDSARRFRVWVSDGAIEVVGTKFVVEQEVAGGNVEVTEGRVRFLAKDGSSREVGAGESLRWPFPVGSDAAATGNASPTPIDLPSADDVNTFEGKSHEDRHGSRTSGHRNEDLSGDRLKTFLHEIDSLRSQQRYEKAVDRLRQALRQVQNREIAEELSFEAGSLLTFQIQKTGEACRHWALHKREFRETPRYDAAIQRAEERLGCAQRQ